MPQEITRTQIEKYTVYTGPTAESFSPIMAGITYPDPAYEILVYRRPLCVFEYVFKRPWTYRAKRQYPHCKCRRCLYPYCRHLPPLLFRQS